MTFYKKRFIFFIALGLSILGRAQSIGDNYANFKLIDSISLTNSALPSGECRIFPLDSNFVLMYFPQLGLMIKYDIKYQKLLKYKLNDLGINAENLLKINSELNDGQIEFDAMNQHQLSPTPRYLLESIYVNKDAVYLGIRVNFIFIDSSQHIKNNEWDSTYSIYGIAYVLECSKDFNIKNIYSLPSLKPVTSKYYVQNNFFWITEKKEIITDIETEGDTLIGLMKLIPEKKASYMSILPFSVPPFFPERTNDGSTPWYWFNLIEYKEQLFAYFFNWNEIYNTTNNKKYKLIEPTISNDEFIKKITEDNYKELIGMHQLWFKNDKAYLIAHAVNNQTFLYCYKNDFSRLLKKTKLLDSSFYFYQSISVFNDTYIFALKQDNESEVRTLYVFKIEY